MITEINLIEDILTKTFVNQSEIGSDTLYVDDNPTELEIEKISKINSVIHKTKEVKKIVLDSKELSINCKLDIYKEISDSINSELISKLKETNDIEKIKMKKKFLGIFNAYDFKNIDNVIKNYDWILVNPSIVRHIKKIGFDLQENSISETLTKVGTINSTFVFTSNKCEKDNIFLGMSDSVSSTFLSKISLVKKSNIYDIKLDYAITHRGIRKLILE